MPAAEEPSSGPVIHDHRRIDPVTGQVRGKHAASKPAGTRGAGRPAPAADAAEPAESTGSARSAGSQEDQDAQETQKYPEEVPEVVTSEAAPGGQQQAPAADGKQAGDVGAQLAERTADLQRLQAEYANYRKRVDRDRAAVREQAVAGTLAGLLPVLDAIDQARLVTYGDKGDPFDPKIHEALTHSYSSDVTEDTCVEILQPGYKVGDRILRPARVAVAAPATGPDGSSNEPEWPTEEDS
ncbi:MAG: nucleotide exchange factor GrpE [Streptosporangiaceae bacterium]